MKLTLLRMATLPLAATLAFCVGQLGSGQAEETHAYLIAANDGYGLSDCLSDGGECGQIVADAWCEAHQKKQAVAFGLASDITGSIGEKTRKPEPGDVIVACRD